MEPQTQSEYQPDYEEQQYDESVDQAFDVSNAAAADAIPQQATLQSEPPPVNRRATPEGSRNGLIRALLIGIGAIIVIIIVLVGGFSLYKSSHNQPLTVEAYPNATVINKAATANSDSVTYTSLDSVDLVADFYSRLLGSSAESGCKRIYLDAQTSDAPGRSFYRCVVDSSMLEVQQVATVTIRYIADPNDSAGGHTQIEVARVWGSGS